MTTSRYLTELLVLTSYYFFKGTTFYYCRFYLYLVYYYSVLLVRLGGAVQLELSLPVRAESDSDSEFQTQSPSLPKVLSSSICYMMVVPGLFEFKFKFVHSLRADSEST